MVDKKKFFILLFLCQNLQSACDPNYHQNNIKRLAEYISISSDISQDLLHESETIPLLCNKKNHHDTHIPLFNHFPALTNTIPHIALADLPTPIVHCATLEKHLGTGKKIYIKQDSLTGKRLPDGSRLFGGNKVRKLEFLLADALAHNARAVLTFGCAGSNHALATAVYAQEIGLKSILMLKPQWNSYVTRRNLLLDLASDAHVVYMPTNKLRAIATVYECMHHKLEHGTFPYIIPTGGSCPLGALGFVNAAFELKEQIDAGLMPMPERIYVPLGSAGTLIGLLVGLKLSGINALVHAITVEPENESALIKKLKKLFYATQALLKNSGANTSAIMWEDLPLTISYNHSGSSYSLFTREAVNARALLNESEKIALDGVYTGKAFAGMLGEIKSHSDNETILFWNTFCADEFADSTALADYYYLPKALHTYFEENVQPLDRLITISQGDRND